MVRDDAVDMFMLFLVRAEILGEQSLNTEKTPGYAAAPNAHAAVGCMSVCPRHTGNGRGAAPIVGTVF